MVSRHLVEIQENARKKRRVILRKSTTYGAIAFKTEDEEFTLDIDKDGHATIVKGPLSRPGLLLSGPYEAFSSMFRGQQLQGLLPDSVTVTILNSSGGAFPSDRVSQEALREALRSGAWKVLKRLFE
jgi:hypothetical protein